MAQSQPQKASPGKSNALAELKTGRDTTLKVPRWDRYVAGREAEDDGHFRKALETHGQSDAWATLSREVFAKMYGSGTTTALPTEERPLGHEWVEQVHATAESLPEYRALATRAQRDAWACGVAAGEVLQALAGTVTPPQSDPQDAQDELDMLKSMSEGSKTSPRHLKRMAQAQRNVKDAMEEHARAARMLGAKAAVMRSAIRGASMRAQEQIAEFDEAMMTLGAGDTPGVMSRIDAPRAECRKALMRNAKFRRIMKRAGRMKAAAIAKQRDKARPGAEELCDVKPGNDIARLLPVELGLLAMPETEVLLARKLGEREALTYELRGKEHRAEGPIIMMVDESGSMSGDPDEWAKSIAFGLMEIAARQNRPFIYGHFDTRVSRVDVVDKPKSIGLNAIEELCTYFTGGGTSIGVALDRAAKMLEQAHKERTDSSAKPWKRADVILVTDGLSGDHAPQKDAIKRIKALGGHLYSFFVGFDPGPTNQEPCSVEADEKVTITSDDIRAGDPSKLGNVFSI
jgi:uncharacterized protein with von Willebrand factor type A (vWA) domain